MSRNLEGRIKYAELGALAPKVQSAMMALSKAVEESGLDHQLLNLVKLRASQINGCAFCVQMHSADARKYGISEERLQLLCVWRETSLYSDRERAALAWCESITLIAEHGMPADLYAQGKAVFSDVEIAHLVSAIVLINSWNRFSIAFHFRRKFPPSRRLQAIKVNVPSQKEKARALLSLHRGPNIFVLPNAWDASSARLFELAGFPAIATTSGGIAALFGYPDGQKVPPALMLAMVGRIAQSVSAPVTADLEAGYGTSIEEVAGTVKEAIAQGIVGMNFEDSTRRTEQPLAEIGYQTDLIKGIRAVGEKMDVPIVLNARVDPYLIASMDESTRFKEAVQRGNAYRSAGADSIFVIGVSARETIRQLVREIDAPINIMAGAGSPSIAELEQLGVARVSFGTGPMRAALPLVHKMAVDLRASGDFELMKQSAFSHAAVNQMFGR